MTAGMWQRQAASQLGRLRECVRHGHCCQLLPGATEVCALALAPASVCKITERPVWAIFGNHLGSTGGGGELLTLGDMLQVVG